MAAVDFMRSASRVQRRLTPVMRQHHVAGDKAFVDYSGILTRSSLSLPIRFAANHVAVESSRRCRVFIHGA